MTRFFGRPHGSVTAIPSKSAAHRHMICAALAQGRSVIRGLPGELPDDLTATLGCIRALGAAAVFRDGALEITGINAKPDVLRLDCRDSGATYRLLYPVAPIIAGRAEFILSPSLAARPMEPVTELLNSKGVAAEKLSVSGSFGPGEFPIRGDVSSQYISGLLLALSLLEGESLIRLTTPLQSKSYVELTRASLALFGGESQWKGRDTILVKPRRLKAADVTVEGDYTHASLFLAAGAVYGPVTVTGLDPGSIQGDRAMLSILDRMGARVDMGGGSVTVSPGRLRGIDVDVSDTPDLAPAIALAALAAEGSTVVKNGGRLRFKECDRISAIATELKRLGADIDEAPDGFTIRGGGKLHGAACLCHNDHRIAMLLIMAAGLCGGIELNGAECVSKSAPGFFDEYRQLGGSIS